MIQFILNKLHQGWVTKMDDMENVKIGKEKYLHVSSHVLLLLMHCSCMLMEERSIHRLISQYYATVSNYKWCHVCNWWFHFRENGTHYKITGQERIPVKITISIRKKQWCAGETCKPVTCRLAVIHAVFLFLFSLFFCHI